MSDAQIEIALRLGAAIAAGALIGIERTYRGRPAGFRTHALVCLASAMLMIVTVFERQWMTLVPIEAIRIDPTRMAQGIMTGIGFLGAGVIFKDGPSVRGLTTAASIWATAALGVLFGVGMYVEAALGTLAILAVLTVFLSIERRLGREYYTHHRLRFDRKAAMTAPEVRDMIGALGFHVAELGTMLRDGGTILEYRMVIHGPDPRDLDRLAQHLLTRPEIIEFQLTPTAD
jgi:putative Mg2+ transporter-C (MgtC) family protein